MKTKPCTLGPKHKWTHVRDVTLKNVSIGPGGTRIKFSARGEYKCECGASRYGQSKSGVYL
jgi:hypothetical protein